MTYFKKIMATRKHYVMSNILCDLPELHPVCYFYSGYDFFLPLFHTFGITYPIFSCLYLWSTGLIYRHLHYFCLLFFFYQNFLVWFRCTPGIKYYSYLYYNLLSYMPFNFFSKKRMFSSNS